MLKILLLLPNLINLKIKILTKFKINRNSKFIINNKQVLIQLLKTKILKEVNPRDLRL